MTEPTPSVPLAQSPNCEQELQREREARLRAEQEAAALARLAAERRQMVDVLAHEVRGALNNASVVLQGAGAMLAQKAEDAAAARLARAQTTIADVQHHVENLLALSTLLAGTAPAALPPEAEDDIDGALAVARAELPAAERGRVTLTRLTGARLARMDPSLVRLALRNLLGNAIRHTPPGSPVELRASDNDAPLELYIDVIDQGSGLPTELLPRLFERGARTRHADGRLSHGLGLFIARRAMQLQGGELRLLHTGAHGTALRLVLPQGPSER